MYAQLLFFFVQCLLACCPDTIGLTDLGAPELFVQCHRANVPHVQRMMNFMYKRISAGHALLHGHSVNNCGLVYRARRITNGDERTLYNEQYLSSAAWYYGREVDVTELTGLVRTDGLDGPVLRPFDAMKKARVCAHCVAHETEKRKLLKCGGCGHAYYCSKACQKANWALRHKRECKQKCQLCEQVCIEFLFPFVRSFSVLIVILSGRLRRRLKQLQQ